MVMKICSISGCEKSVVSWGWCGMHYQRWRKYGSPDGGARRYSDIRDAFANRTEPDGECAIWVGSLARGGYGRVWHEGRQWAVHRLAYTLKKGPIAEGMQVDHVCHNRACVNVDHLRLATPAENSRNHRGADCDSKTGVRNVHPYGDRYIVAIRKTGKLHYFGVYDKIEDAAKAAESGRHVLFGEFAGPPDRRISR